LNRFWAAWQDVATNPSNIAMRNVLLERGETLTDSMNSIARNLDDYNTQLVGGLGPFTGLIPDKVAEINSLATHIQALNSRITVAKAQNVNVNDLLDERDRVTRELSSLAGITVDAVDHTIRIDGQVLVSGDGVTRNDLTLDSVGPLQFSVGGTPVTITAGELNGYAQTQDVTTTLRGNLDTLAIELQTQINTLHTAGYDLNGDPGLDFFTGTDAGDISINTAMYNPANPLLNDPTLVAAAAVLDPGPPPRPNVGDGANALGIADLFSVRMVALGNQTFNEYFTNVTAGVGTAVQAVQGAATDDQTALDAYANAMQSIDGVSMDEELLDMMGAQRAFQAAARLVTTIDEMMDTVINQMKR
jgi:flagellar hook-associated protein 1 FlgK